MIRAVVAVTAVFLATGCSSAGSKGTPLISNDEFQLTSGLKVTLNQIATGALVLGAIHLIYDPLAPNWDIEETRLTEDTFRLSMKMKRYHTGGAGESMQALRRRALQLQGELGFGAYQLTEYNEGIDSQTLGARRVAEGTIRLVQRQVADSFLLNEQR